jgi:hypothetical protein
MGLVGTALPQMIIYLAAVQDRRKAATKENTCVFGMFTDSSTFVFVHLDENWKLFVSKPYEWRCDKDQILKWIDKILHDAIESTPNTTIRNYPSYLNESFQFGIQVADRDIRPWLVIRNDPSGNVIFQLEEPE